MDAPWKSHSRLRANCSRAGVSLLCQTWSPALGWIRSTSGPQPCSRARAQRRLAPTQLLEPGHVLHSCLPGSWSDAPEDAAGRAQAFSGLGREVQGVGSTWPWEPGRSLQATPPFGGQLALVSSLGKVWLRKVPESGGLQDAFDGSRCSQAATWLVGHRVHGDPEAPPE